MVTLSRADAQFCARYIVDDALNGRRIGSTQYDNITALTLFVCWHNLPHGSWIVCAVKSYLGVAIDNAEATELARDYLAERFPHLTELLATDPACIV
jgi:hypothetical protein